MGEPRLQAQLRRVESMIGAVLLLCGLASAMTACAQTTAASGSDVNNPAVSPGALNNGTSIGPSEGVSTPPGGSY